MHLAGGRRWHRRPPDTPQHRAEHQPPGEACGSEPTADHDACVAAPAGRAAATLLAVGHHRTGLRRLPGRRGSRFRLGGEHRAPLLVHASEHDDPVVVGSDVVVAGGYPQPCSLRALPRSGRHDELQGQQCHRARVEALERAARHRMSDAAAPVRRPVARCAGAVHRPPTRWQRHVHLHGVRTARPLVGDVGVQRRRAAAPGAGHARRQRQVGTVQPRQRRDVAGTGRTTLSDASRRIERFERRGTVDAEEVGTVMHDRVVVVVAQQTGFRRRDLEIVTLVRLDVVPADADPDVAIGAGVLVLQPQRVTQLVHHRTAPADRRHPQRLGTAAPSDPRGAGLAGHDPDMIARLAGGIERGIDELVDADAGDAVPRSDRCTHLDHRRRAHPRGDPHRHHAVRPRPVARVGDTAPSRRAGSVVARAQDVALDQAHRSARGGARQRGTGEHHGCPHRHDEQRAAAEGSEARAGDGARRRRHARTTAIPGP